MKCVIALGLKHNAHTSIKNKKQKVSYNSNIKDHLVRDHHNKSDNNCSAERVMSCYVLLRLTYGFKFRGFTGKITTLGFPGGSDYKESACNAGDPSVIPGSGRSPGEGIGYPLQILGLPW